jgi:hypothetical protein
MDGLKETLVYLRKRMAKLAELETPVICNLGLEKLSWSFTTLFGQKSTLIFPSSYLKVQNLIFKTLSIE